jgi:hypothetical protein
MPVIESLLAGKLFDVAFDGTGDALRAFFKQDALGRLFVLLHADFGEETKLGRDVFYSWRVQEPLAGALGELLAGTRGVEPEELAELAALIEPHLVRTPEQDRAELAARIATAALSAAPFAVGDEATALLLNRLEAGQRRMAEAIGLSSTKQTAGLAAALVVGPLRHVGAVEELAAAEQLAEEGAAVKAADAILQIVARLDREGLRSASETLRERAAILLASAGERPRVLDLLIGIVEANIERGERWAAEPILALIETLQGEDDWIAAGLRARITWPEYGPAVLEALDAAANASVARPDHVNWVAAQSEVLLLFGEIETVLAATQTLSGAPLADGARLALELDRLDALQASGNLEAADAGWLGLLRWADREAGAESRGIAWQRRGLGLARREDVPGAEDAYRRAMDAWAGTPGFEEQAGDAFFSLGSVYLVNGRVNPPDADLRPLAHSLRGSSETPVARAERLASEAMSNRLSDKLPEALYSYWRAYAMQRAAGSLTGQLSSAAVLAEVYAHGREPAQAMKLYVTAGDGQKAATAIAGVYPPGLLAASLDLDTPRWERSAAYHVIGEHGRTLPTEYVAVNAPRVLEEAQRDPDGPVAPQPALGARGALAAIALTAPAELQPDVFAQLVRQLRGNFPDVIQASATALILATNAELTDATGELLDAFLEDPYLTGISSFWIAEQASSDSTLREPLRNAAVGGNVAAMEALVVADLVGEDDELKAACDRVVDGASGAHGVEEVREGDEVRFSVGMGMNLGTPAILARISPEELRSRFLAGMLALVGDEREPESNRASAAGALFNLAPALSEEQAVRVNDTLLPLALGGYDLSRWDENVGTPLTRFNINLHIPNSLRTAAIGTVAQLVARHPGLDPAGLERAINAALGDGAAVVLAAGLDAIARVPSVAVPFPPDVALGHPDQSVRCEAFRAWAARNHGIPDAELLKQLRDDHGVNLRLAVLQLLHERAPANELVQWFATSDPDSCVRAIALQRLGATPQSAF